MQRLIAIALIAVLGLLPAGVSAVAVATTSEFKEKNGLPVSATTIFKENYWKKHDRKNVSHHELTHALGHTVAYKRFASRTGGDRSFHENANAKGKVLAKLVPKSAGTHIDPAGGTVNTYRQSEALMRPSVKPGYYIGGQEEPMLAAPFWKDRKLSITIKYVGSWNTVQKNAVEDAKAEAQTKYSKGSKSHNFVWKVQVTGQSESIEEEPLDTDGLIAAFRSGDMADRKKALRALLESDTDRSVQTLEVLDAQPMASLSPPLESVAYSLITRSAGAPYRTDAFGLHVTPESTIADIREMGERRGFVVAEDEVIDPETQPTLYVTVKTGRDLFSVMTETLMEEDAVLNVNLNHFEE